MARRLKSMPKNLSHMTRALQIVLDPIIHNIELRFLGKNSDERVLTRGDLKTLGIVTDDDLQKLDD